MKPDIIKRRISDMCSHFTFTYHGKECGIDPISANYFEIWCGDISKAVTSINDVMTTPFFDGNCLSEICDDIDIIDF